MTSLEQVSEAVEPFRQSLVADGYDLVVERGNGSIRFRIVAMPDACEDCLVPPSVLRPMIEAALVENNVPLVDWELEYPSG